MPCALFDAYPDLVGRLPHRALGTFPTAIERLPGLLPGRRAPIELWVKRDDRSGTLYGGNKVRKLEFLLADPRLSRPRDGRAAPGLFTLGGYGSHHVLATTLYGRELGLPVSAVVYPQPATEHARDTLRLILAAGAYLCPSRGYLDVPWQAWRARRLLSGLSSSAPMPIAPGGSSAVGTLGWVSGGLEIAGQVRAGEAPRFDAVYVALGSCGTAAGLWLGLGESAATLVAVRVVPALVANGLVLRRLAGVAADLLDEALAPAHPPRPASLRPRLRIDGRFLGPGYGHVTAQSAEAVRRSRGAGLELETTYTGKAMAALLHDAEAGLLDGKRVLFVHTYSSADLSALRSPSARGLSGDPADVLPRALADRLRRFCTPALGPG
jgi:1-aminocyclopropane-1-carboxylate deaminase/D-cysteine desulfhydrase-like pyridoxal-dependent ACC family enzyme